MELFKRGNTTEEKNETPEMPTMTDDLEVVELEADDSAVQSARAAVEAMKNSSYFSHPVSEAGSNGLPPTSPIFSAEQLSAEMPTDSPAVNLADETAITSDEFIAKTSADLLDEANKEPVQETVEEPAQEATTVSFEGPAQSAAEAVARMNTSASNTSAEPVAVDTSVAAIVEEDPEWKVSLDAVDSSVAEKADATIVALKEQITALEEAANKQIQDLLSAMRSQLKIAEDEVKKAVKEAGSSTEKVVEAEKTKLISAFELEKKAMNANFDKQLAELQEKHEAEISELKAEHNQEMVQVKDEHITALDKMKNMYGEQMEEMQTAYREKNAALKKEMDQYKEKLDILMLEHDTDPFMNPEPLAPAPVAAEDATGGLE